MREYELMFVVDPRLTDEQTVELADQYRQMIESAGGEVYKEESWGKRKLAYPIANLSEASYILFYVRSDNGSPFAEVEQRMRQSEQVLRYLTVRMDSGRLRRRDVEEEAGDSAATPASPTRSKSLGSEEKS